MVTLQLQSRTQTSLSSVRQWTAAMMPSIDVKMFTVKNKTLEIWKKVNNLIDKMVMKIKQCEFQQVGYGTIDKTISLVWE